MKIQCVFASQLLHRYEGPNIYNGLIYTLCKKEETFWGFSTIPLKRVGIGEIKKMCLRLSLPYMGIAEGDIHHQPFNQRAFDGAMARLSSPTE